MLAHHETVYVSFSLAEFQVIPSYQGKANLLRDLA